MRQIRFHHAETASDAFFSEGVESVLYIRCMEHRAAPKINEAESGQGECGECIRQQCWKDMLGLLASVIADTSKSASGPYALKLLQKTLTLNGIGTFGMSDELEEDSHAATAGRAEQGNFEWMLD
jgi:hypothetical protein